MFIRRIGVTGAVVVAAMSVGAPAYAVGEDGVGNAGVAAVPASSGQVTPVGPLAECDVYGTNQATSAEVRQTGVVRYGEATASCVQDEEAEKNLVQIEGDSFQLDAFVTASRQRIRTGEYSVRCEGTATGTTYAQFTIRNIRGVTPPNPVGENATVWVNGTLHGTPAKAKVVFRETLKDGTGGLDLTAMHVYLYGADDTSRGHAAIGRASCSPFA
ncbi:hypothetical protein [Amycolatopsis albispora]|uniref:Tat pathway signal sequence domain protein n=1 Tax=Amycolatopsis albispora TaxID=1804986 RepID=A0A344LE39_9PSEU|nr:hypothetical protein [Amycolatopsis albispora]AXB46313.1 hypothetical protein A4R43_30840 [Amycolatopsis albispora]